MSYLHVWIPSSNMLSQTIRVRWSGRGPSAASHSSLRCGWDRHRPLASPKQHLVLGLGMHPRRRQRKFNLTYFLFCFCNSSYASFSASASSSCVFRLRIPMRPPRQDNRRSRRRIMRTGPAILSVKSRTGSNYPTLALHSSHSTPLESQSPDQQRLSLEVRLLLSLRTYCIELNDAVGAGG